MRALSHSEEAVRRMAVGAVGYYASGLGVGERLAELAEGDPSEAVRATAAEERVKYGRKLFYFS